MFVTSANFNLLPYNLQNVEGNADFALFITQEEQRILIETFGRWFYDAFILGVEALPDAWDDATEYDEDDEVSYNGKVWISLTDVNLDNAPEEGVFWTEVTEKTRWLFLRDGGYYEASNGKQQYWEGMALALTPAIYYAWLAARINQVNSDDSVVMVELENGSNTSPRLALQNAYNDHTQKFACLRDYFYNSGDTFDDVIVGSGYSDFQNYLVEAMEWPETINEFDI